MTIAAGHLFPCILNVHGMNKIKSLWKSGVGHVLRCSLAADNVTSAAISGDDPSVTARMFDVVTAKATLAGQVPNVIGVPFPPHLHRWKDFL